MEIVTETSASQLIHDVPLVFLPFVLQVVLQLIGRWKFIQETVDPIQVWSALIIPDDD